MLAEDLGAHANSISQLTKRWVDRLVGMLDVDLDKPNDAERKTTAPRKCARYSRAQSGERRLRVARFGADVRCLNDLFLRVPSTIVQR